MSGRSVAAALADSGGFGTRTVAVVDDDGGSKQHEGRRREEEPQGPEANDARMRASSTERRTIDQLQVDVRSCGCRRGAPCFEQTGGFQPF